MVVVGGLCYGLFWYGNLLLTPMSRDPKAPGVMVDIPVGAHASVIADRLKKAKLIRSETVFKLAVRFYGGGEDMKAGEYRISPGLGVFEIIDKLVAGDAEAQWVVIPEGMGLSDIARRLENRRLAKRSSFLRLARRKPKSLGLNVPVSLSSTEGYLMPDTYKFPKRISERQIIKEMLENWEQKVYRPNAALFRASSLPLDKLMVVASMIEREAKVDKDRALISSVIRNRLAKNRKLEIDATVIYALGGHKKELSLADLKVKSPYNTYYKVGLPPGPICNPGLESVMAALKPAKTPYLYYVARPDGSHIFSETYEQHKAAIAEVKAMKAASPSAAQAAN